MRLPLLLSSLRKNCVLCTQAEMDFRGSGDRVMQMYSKRIVLLSLTLLLTSTGCVGLNRLPGFGDSPPPSPGTSKKDLPKEESAEACLAVAESLHSNGHKKEAVLGYERARQLNPRYKHLTKRLAVLYDELGIAEKAQEEYEKALKEYPRNANLINNYGRFHYNRGKWAESEEYFRKAIAIENKHQWAWNNLGSALAQMNRYEESLAAYEEVNSKAVAHQNLAFHLATQGKHEQARKVYMEALRLNPNLELPREALRKYDQVKNHPVKTIQQDATTSDTTRNTTTMRPALQPSSFNQVPSNMPNLPPVEAPSLGRRDVMTYPE